MKFEKERCLECSICAIFFSSSLVDSISARLRRRILSDMLIRLESKEPAHGALSSHGDSLENLVAMNALVMADTQRCGVHEIDTGAFSKKNFFDKNKQWDSDFLLQFHKPVIRNRSRKKMTTMFTYIIDIEMFQTSEPTHVKHYGMVMISESERRLGLFLCFFPSSIECFLTVSLKKCRSRLPYRKFQ